MPELLKNYSMDELKTSDLSATMVANRAYDSILEQIQTSNLNFHLQISPFSTLISMKKTPVKDRTGVPILPLHRPPQSSLAEIAVLASKNVKLEKDLMSLRQEYESCAEDCEAAHMTIKSLKNQTTPEKEIKMETDEAFHRELYEKNFALETLEFELKQLNEENINNKRLIENQKVEINDLEISKQKQSQISNKINKELNEAKNGFQKEKKAIFKQHRAEVKSWRKELGEEIKLKIKLEDKLLETNHQSEEAFSEFALTPSANKLSFQESLLAVVPKSSKASSEKSFCSICANTITNYIPKYFLDEMINPACDKCDDKTWIPDDNIMEATPQTSSYIPDIKTEPVTPKGFNTRPSNSSQHTSSTSVCSHTPQCILRQPFPSPLPALTPLVNEYSLYHKKTMAGELDWGSTCWYCMRIDYEKYGCDSCVWIKCFRELNGYPDVNPYDYKEHL